MYEGFVTFTTTGYGDYSPQTPAGRSIFVFWALLGLATMTILVSGTLDTFRGSIFFAWCQLENSFTGCLLVEIQERLAQWGV